MSRKPGNVRKAVLEQQIDEVNKLIAEFERELVVLHDELDPESDSDLRQIMATQEQLDTYYEMKEVFQKLLEQKGE